MRQSGYAAFAIPKINQRSAAKAVLSRSRFDLFDSVLNVHLFRLLSISQKPIAGRCERYLVPSISKRSVFLHHSVGKSCNGSIWRLTASVQNLAFPKSPPPENTSLLLRLTRNEAL